MTEHMLARHMKGFHYHSYLVGINTAFAEVVSAGCKKLALSSPLTEEQYKAIIEATKTSAENYHTPLYVEKELLTTLMFPPNIAKDKIVILIAHDENVLTDYQKLKAYKKEHEDSGTLTREVEYEIARRFGSLLSYDELSIERLIQKNRDKK